MTKLNKISTSETRVPSTTASWVCVSKSTHPAGTGEDSQAQGRFLWAAWFPGKLGSHSKACFVAKRKFGCLWVRPCPSPPPLLFFEPWQVGSPSLKPRGLADSLNQGFLSVFSFPFAAVTQISPLLQPLLVLLGKLLSHSLPSCPVLALSPYSLVHRL